MDLTIGDDMGSATASVDSGRQLVEL